MRKTGPSLSDGPEGVKKTGRRQSASAALHQTFRALRNRNYRLFWSGQVISAMGTWMQRIALAWLVLEITNSPLALGLVTTFQTLPVLFLSLFGGVIADRVSKRKLLLVTQAVKLVPSAVLAILVILGNSNLVAIYILATLLGITNAIDSPARQAFVKELAGPDDLPNAIALNSIVFNSARLIGPALGGLTIAWVGVAGCFTIDALSFVAVLIGLAMMREEELYDVPNPPKGRMLNQITEGVRYAARTPDIALVLILMAVIGTFGYNFTVLLPLIAKYVLDAGPIGFGILTSSMAVGSLSAAVGIAYSGRVSRRTLMIGATGFPVLLTGLALSNVWLTTVAVLIALGVFSITFSATANSRLQMLSAPEMRGRVMSFYTLLFMGSTPIGSLVIGTLADHQGVQTATAEVALICAIGVVIGYLYIRAHSTDPVEQPVLHQQQAP